MRITLSLLFFIAFGNVYSQDTIKIKEIDFLVKNINQSNLPTQLDTIIQDLPEIGLKMITNLKVIVHDNKLMKYENFVNSTTIQNGISKEMISSNTFYFYQNQLIKIEEFAIDDEKKIELDWYYSEGKLLYCTSQFEKAKDRANLLLNLSNTILKQIVK